MTRTRRDFLIASATGGVAMARVLALPRGARAADESSDFVEQVFGRKAVESTRLHLKMPKEFPTGYTVPMDIEVESPMTEADHVKYVRVFAPRNPIVEVVRLQFTPERSVARMSTRVRLAAPQFVVAVAEMSDGELLMAKAWVDVASNGCA